LDHRDLHSFPTRRSSDLQRSQGTTGTDNKAERDDPEATERTAHSGATDQSTKVAACELEARCLQVASEVQELPGENWSMSSLIRSEEHTSELQSPDHLVC